MLQIMNEEDKKVSNAVAKELNNISHAVDMVSNSLKNDGRLFYVGAGSSGRLGVLDAAECPPTFGTASTKIQGIIAGGERAVFTAVESAEDDPNGATKQLEARKIRSKDVVLGIAASGVTPYVNGALEYAHTIGCKTIFLTCNVLSSTPTVDTLICPVVGPEVITGSTRLKAGTATKLVLNMISTGSMVSLGKTYGNLMVDLKPTNKKLIDRSIRIFCSIAKITEVEAESYLKQADNDLKIALVMKFKSCDKEAASRLLSKNSLSVKAAILSK
jgi:N-acetylmuramic acid 6-phosphate etherase